MMFYELVNLILRLYKKILKNLKNLVDRMENE